MADETLRVLDLYLPAVMRSPWLAAVIRTSGTAALLEVARAIARLRKEMVEAEGLVVTEVRQLDRYAQAVIECPLRPRALEGQRLRTPSAESIAAAVLEAAAMVQQARDAYVEEDPTSEEAQRHREAVQEAPQAAEEASTARSESADLAVRVGALEASAGGGGGNMVLVWAEENAGLGTGSYEWAFGNGGNVPVGSGVVLPVAGELVALGLALRAGVATVALIVDGVQAAVVTADATLAAVGARNVLGTPLAIAAGSRLVFRTITAAGANTGPNVVSALIRLV